MAVLFQRLQHTDPRLGRHVHHDDRSRDYAVDAADTTTLKSVRHDRWAPIFDQGQVGSCTANAAVGCLGTTNLWPTAARRLILGQDPAFDEKTCVRFYSAEQRLLFGQPYPPSDQGGSGLAIAKILKRRGLIPSYRHAFSPEAVLTALAAQPVIVGIPWYEGMFTPDQAGRIRPTGQFVGGHEIELDELDMTGQQAGFDQSWGEWGVDGRGYIALDDLAWLLAQQGDCTVFDHA